MKATLPLLIIAIFASAAGGFYFGTHYAQLHAPVPAVSTSPPSPTVSATKPITFASEVQRGVDAANQCTNDIGRFDGWSGCLAQVVSANQQRNTDTDGFVLGTQFGFSRRVNEFCEHVPALSDTSARQYLDLLRISGNLERFKFVTKQQELHLADGELAKALDVSEEDLVKWKKGPAPVAKNDR